MKMTDEIRIAAPRETVFEKLNDPDILKACIRGCESLEKISDSEMKATVMAKVGPVRSRFNGTVRLSDINPPESYTISGEGRGGAAGFAKGGANVHLAAEGDETVLRYDVKADVGGKLAQLGSRLIDATARSYARDFFAAFKSEVEGPGPAGAGEVEAEGLEQELPMEAVPVQAGGVDMRLWLLLAAVIGVVIMLFAMN